MNDENEIEIYHVICDISRACKDYFYGRKNLPKDFWQPKGDINRIIKLTAKLKKMIGGSNGSKNK